MQQIHRRRFVYAVTGMVGAAGTGVSGWLFRSGADAAESDRARPAANDGRLDAATRTSWALGADVSMTALHRDQALAQQAIDAAFGELERVDQVMSIYRPHSQLSRLNREGVLEDPDPRFVEVLRAAQKLSQRSGGVFDITVQPLWRLFHVANVEGRMPDAASIEATRRRVNWRQVEVGNGRVRLRGEATAITLNGIAQGYAADRAMAALRAHGIKNALVDTGEFGAKGHKSDGAWTVGIQHPRREDAFIALVPLDGRCLATSGDYATTFSEDNSYNHLFDPRTGRSPTELSSVTVVAPSGMQADAISTAVSVLGPDKGLELIRATPNVDALLVLKSGRTRITGGFPRKA